MQPPLPSGRMAGARPAASSTRAMALGAVGVAMLATFALPARAEVTIIPQSALIPSQTLYTTDIGGGVGAPLVMTGGGNAAGVGGSRNDDGFSGPINLGFSLNFFGNTYTQFYANNNGNISFGNGNAQYTPSGPQGASSPVISPFFADVDTRGAASGVMSLRNDIANQIIVTWSNVGYYSARDNLLNTFQLVLRGSNYAVPAGQGQIGFFWTTMQWETGEASGGTNGFGGTPAAVGFGDGQSNGQVLQGSTLDGIAAVLQNRRLWFNVSDTGVPVVIPPTDGGGGVGVIPEPSTYALMAVGLLGLAFAGLRRRREDAPSA